MNKKEFIYYGLLFILVLILFSLLGVIWWQGFIIFILGALQNEYNDFLQGLIKTKVEGSKESEDGLGY